MRDGGQKAELTRKSDKHDLDEYKTYARRMNLTRVIYLDENGNTSEI
jgi:hypothetical protein